LSHFLQTYFCKAPTFFSEPLLPQTKNIPSPHTRRLHVPADHYCLPTFKHGVKTTQNLNTHVRIHNSLTSPPMACIQSRKDPTQNVMCVYPKTPIPVAIQVHRSHQTGSEREIGN